jgi:FixJ family two-component response regulator
MTQRTCLHILARSEILRARLARLTFAAGHHAEVYDSVDELVRAMPASGFGLVQDDSSIATLHAQCQTAGFWLPYVAFCDHPVTAQVVKAMRSKVMDYVFTPQTVAEITALIATNTAEADRQRQAFNRSIAFDQRLEELSPRELQVLGRIADGLSNKGIARELGISPRTVEIHRAKLMGKLGAHSAAEAVRLYVTSQFGKSPCETAPASTSCALGSGHHDAGEAIAIFG